MKHMQENDIPDANYFDQDRATVYVKADQKVGQDEEMQVEMHDVNLSIQEEPTYE